MWNDWMEVQKEKSSGVGLKAEQSSQQVEDVVELGTSRVVWNLNTEYNVKIWQWQCEFLFCKFAFFFLLYNIFILLSYVSLVLHIFCIVTIAIAWTGVEFCIDDDIYAFLDTFGFLGTLPAILFTFGTILGVISFLPLIYVISNTVVFIISCITIGIALFLCVQLFESIKKFYWDKANKYLIKNKTNKIRPSDETGDDNWKITFYSYK